MTDATTERHVDIGTAMPSMAIESVFEGLPNVYRYSPVRA